MTDRTMAPAADADITPFGMSCAGGEPPLGGPGAVSVGSWHRAQSRSSPSAEEACRFRAVSMSAEVRNWAHAGTDDLPDRCPWSAGPTLLHGMARRPLVTGAGDWDMPEDMNPEVAHKLTERQEPS